MPRFFFNVSNGHGFTPDDEGLELEGQTAARNVAIDSIRSMVSEDARAGVIDLTGRIDIKDSADNTLTTVSFDGAFELRIPAELSDKNA